MTNKFEESILNACFPPPKIDLIQPDAASMLEESLQAIPFLNSTEIFESLKTDLHEYLTRAVDTNDEILPLEWWKLLLWYHR